MSVTNGQPSNATVYNGAFVSRTTDTSTVGVLTLNNSSNPFSGPQVTNVQRYLNELADIAGVTSEGDASAFLYATNFWLVDGEDRKQSLERLDGAFNPASGHTHDGVDSPLVSASDLDDLNYYSAEWQNFAYTAASGLSVTITTQMSGKTPGGTATAVGVVTAPPYNRCEIVDNNTLQSIVDGFGRRVYGRVTELGGIWTLTFYVLIAGVETPHSLTSADILVTYREVFTLETIPTFSQNVGVLGSYDVSATIPDATTAVAGKVLLASLLPSAVADTPSIGSGLAVALSDHVHEGIHSMAIDGVVGPALLGDVLLEPGPGILMTYGTQRIKIEVSNANTTLVDYFTLSGGDITAKQVTLSLAPTAPARVRVDVIGGSAQEYAVDFTVSGAILDWNGLGLDGLLSAGDRLRVSYAADEQVEYRTLTGGEVTAKQLTLAGTPVSAGQTIVDVIGGSSQQYAVDFTVSGAVVDWNGLGLDGLLTAGDILRISYRV